MNKIKKMTLKAKLTFCVSFLSIVTLIVGAIGLVGINTVAIRGGKIYSEGLMPCLSLKDVDQSLTDIHTYYLHIAYGGQAPDLNKLQSKISEQEAVIKSFGEYELDAEGTMLYEALKTNMKNYNDAVYNHVKNISSLSPEALAAEMDQVVSYAEKAQVALNNLFDEAKKTANEREEGNESIASVAGKGLTGVTLVGIVSSLMIVTFIMKGLTHQINSLVMAVERIAQGKLDVEFETSSNDEIGQLARYFKKMVDNLKEVVMNIEAASEQVHMGAKQVAHTSSLLAQGATEQATTVEELTAAVEQINVQIKSNAEHAQSMNDIAVETKSVVEKSHCEMEQMLKAMEDINHSSSEVSKIIKVIDDIAFQTNILALNAAVEAARAGQHGKGFTVVAEEVRNLAARSAQAAKETTCMIESSIKNAQVGMQLAQGAAEELNHVVEGIKEVVELTGEISMSCTEQSVGIEQIGEGALQISNVIQSNSATSQEAAAASEELAGQAELMRSEVSKFETNRKYVNSRGYKEYPEEELPDYTKKQPARIGDMEFGKY